MHQINEFSRHQAAAQRDVSDNKITRWAAGIACFICIILFKHAIGG